MAGKMSSGMARSTFLAKHLPRARPWSSSLVGRDNASVPVETSAIPTEVLGDRSVGSFHEPTWDTMVHPELLGVVY